MKAPDLPPSWHAAEFLAGLGIMAISAYTLLTGLIDGNVSLRVWNFQFVGHAAITMLVCGFLFGVTLALSGWKKWA